MNQHYEWKKATPDNLPDEIHYVDLPIKIHAIIGKVLTIGHYHPNDNCFYSIRDEKYPIDKIEYLAEVAPIEWPGDEEIDKGFDEWMDHMRMVTTFKNSFHYAIHWLKQVTIK